MVDTVKTVMPSGGDYSSSSAWEAGQQKVISSGDVEIAEPYDFVDTTAVVIDGWTTAADAYIVMRTPLTERHTGIRGTGYRLEVNGASAILNFESYVRLEGLALKGYNSASADGYYFSWSAALPSDIRIEGCLAYDCGRHGLHLGEGTYKASANICIGNTTNGIHFEFENASGTGYLYNNTCAANGAYGIRNSLGTVHAKNNYSGGNTTADYNGTFSTNTKNGSSDTTGSASYQSIAYSTSAGGYFNNVTAGSENLHIGASSALAGVGDDLSADASYPITKDVDGATITSWPIGADEYVAAGGGVFIKMVGNNFRLAGNGGLAS